MDLGEDVKKLTAFINQQKLNFGSNNEFEFQDFVNFKTDSTSDQEFEIDDENDDITEEIELKSLIESENSDDLSSVVLTAEERAVIEKCTDAELKSIMLLNRSKNFQLLQLLKRINHLIVDCEEAMEDKDRHLKKLGQARPAVPQANAWKLAAPYFKDKRFFKSPPNEDTVKKRIHGELTSYDLFCPQKWIPVEFDRLTNGVKVNFNVNRQHALVKQLNALKAAKIDGKVRKVGEKDDTDDEKDDKDHQKAVEEDEKATKHDKKDDSAFKKIAELEKKLEEMRQNEILPPLNSDEFIDWQKVSELFINCRHTASECKAIWHMVVHPEINKSDWTDQENTRLESIATRYNHQNWDKIAAELGTNRTGFMTCIHFFSKLNPRFKGMKFTQDEDKLILELVDVYKSGTFIPWNQIACHFEHRSRHQIYHRYIYFLSHNDVKRGKFSEAEDILLMVLVRKFGKNFRKCAEYMPNRSQIQLKSRYNSNLKHHIKKGTFTVEDDKIIYDFVQKHGEKSWRNLTVKLNRCSAQIRQRYRLIHTFLQANPGAKIDQVPKRKHNYKQGEDSHFDFLQCMCDELIRLKTIPTLESIEEALQVKKDEKNDGNDEDSVKDIDMMLTDFFRNTKKPQVNTSHSTVQYDDAATNVRSVLSDLNVSLDIPTDFELDSNLDSVDVEILKRLSGKTETSTPKILTPNLNTAQGLKSLILKHKEHKTQQKYSGDTTKWEMEHELQNLDDVSQRIVLNHRELFSERFVSLFSWTAALSLEKPDNPELPQKIIREKPWEMPVKRRKIDISSINMSAASNSQFQLVDNSVVDKLITNNKNIVKIVSISGPDGVAMPLIQQTPSNVIEKVPQVEIDSKAIQNDVDRLNEMLQFERVKEEFN